MTSEENVWVVPNHLCDIPHTPLLTPSQIKNLSRLDRRTIQGETSATAGTTRAGAPNFSRALGLFFVDADDLQFAVTRLRSSKVLETLPEAWSERLRNSYRSGKVTRRLPSGRRCTSTSPASQKRRSGQRRSYRSRSRRILSRLRWVVQSNSPGRQRTPAPRRSAGPVPRAKGSDVIAQPFLPINFVLFRRRGWCRRLRGRRLGNALAHRGWRRMNRRFRRLDLARVQFPEKLHVAIPQSPPGAGRGRGLRVFGRCRRHSKRLRGRGVEPA